MSVEYNLGYNTGYNEAYKGVMKIIEQKTHITDDIMNLFHNKDTPFDGWCLALSEILKSCEAMYKEEYSRHRKECE